MAGHSKWSNIKYRKGREDAKRGSLFTKLVRDITVAAREGGGDASSNAALRAALDKAKAGNLPKANIERAIARGVGNAGGSGAVESIYEGYGPNGEAILVKCITDNKNRTVSNVRSVFNRHGGSLAEVGAVTYIFSKSLDKPSFTVPLSSEALKKFEMLYNALKELEDVIDVYHNCEFS